MLDLSEINVYCDVLSLLSSYNKLLSCSPDRLKTAVGVVEELYVGTVCLLSLDLLSSPSFLCAVCCGVL